MKMNKINIWKLHRKITKFDIEIDGKSDEN